jgi:hypothetical protein
VTEASQFDLEGADVDVFEKSEPECVVDLEKSSDCGTRELLFDSWSAWHDALCDPDCDCLSSFHCDQNRTFPRLDPADPLNPLHSFGLFV